MTKFAFDRDNVLSPEERIASARKCLNLLTPLTDGMGEKEAQFVDDTENKIDHFGVTERQLMWLRSLHEKYCC